LVYPGTTKSSSGSSSKSTQAAQASSTATAATAATSSSQAVTSAYQNIAWWNALIAGFGAILYSAI
jgi:hypothetical protein